MEYVLLRLVFFVLFCFALLCFVICRMEKVKYLTPLLCRFHFKCLLFVAFYPFFKLLCFPTPFVVLCIRLFSCVCSVTCFSGSGGHHSSFQQHFFKVRQRTCLFFNVD